MLSNIFKTIKDKTNYKNSADYEFYRANTSYLESYPWLKKYINVKDDFSLIRTNIIIRSLINKKIIEATYDFAKATYAIKDEDEQKRLIDSKVKQMKSTLPYLEKNNIKIYIPIFDLASNVIYEDNIEKIDNYPYSLLKDDFKDSMINPFEYYNTAIFSSPFTSLMYLGSDNTSDAYYHPLFETIYFINHQGELDYTIPVFDDKLFEKNTERLKERLTKISDSYFNFNKDGLVDNLLNEGFISRTLYDLLIADINKDKKKKNSRRK